ncbi:MAG TPA: hypothetical protein VII38_23175 [Polyangia bacterium]|jgi:hypothetical protein
MARLFISQQQMDKWTAEGKVRLDDDLMSLPALGRSFRLVSAVCFDRVVDGDDAPGLVGRVKTDAQLAELGAEHYGASVILGELGYECTDGFVGLPVDSGAVGGSGLLKLDS